MPLIVTYTNEAFPEDKEFYVNGLGVLVNGVATEISEDQERAFILENRKTVEDVLSGDESYKLEGTTSVSDGVIGVFGVDPNEAVVEAPVEVAAPAPDNTGVTITATGTAPAAPTAQDPLDALVNTPSDS